MSSVHVVHGAVAAFGAHRHVGDADLDAVVCFTQQAVDVARRRGATSVRLAEALVVHADAQAVRVAAGVEVEALLGSRHFVGRQLGHQHADGAGVAFQVQRLVGAGQVARGNGGGRFRVSDGRVRTRVQRGQGSDHGVRSGTGCQGNVGHGVSPKRPFRGRVGNTWPRVKMNFYQRGSLMTRSSSPKSHVGNHKKELISNSNRTRIPVKLRRKA